MRVAGILGIAVLLAGAAALVLAGRPGRAPAPVASGPPAVSTGEIPRPKPPGPAPVLSGAPAAPVAEVAPPSPPAPEARWSAWSEPVKGLSCRALLPGRAPRGECLPVTVEFRVDPLLLPAGKKYISVREDQGRLVLRKRGGEEAAPVSIDYSYQKVVETPVLEEEGVEAPPRSELEMHPDWLPLADAVGKPMEFRFTLARAWDALVPGEWEARFEIDASGTGEVPSLWSGTLVTAPLQLTLDEPPPRRLRVLVPSLLRVQPGRFRHSVNVGFAEGDGDFVDLEPRNGFSLGISSEVNGGSGWETVGPSWTGFEFGESFGSLDPEDVGPLDRTYEIEIWEAVTDSGDTLIDLMMSRTGRHTLWKKTFRVTATAAEIEALRR